MSIELKEAAQQALKELGEARKIVRASSSRQLAKDWDRRATDALANLRTAIQQAEAQQPATAIACGIPGMAKTTCPYCEQGFAFEHEQPTTGEPVAWLDEMLADTREVFDAGGSETPQVVRDVIEYVKSWVTVYSEKNHPVPAAHPAPSVPDGYVLVPIEPTQAMMNVQT